MHALSKIAQLQTLIPSHRTSSVLYPVNSTASCSFATFSLAIFSQLSGHAASNGQNDPNDLHTSIRPSGPKEFLFLRAFPILLVNAGCSIL